VDRVIDNKMLAKIASDTKNKLFRDSYLADLIPWSATFTGHLKGVEAIYNGSRGNLVGIRTRLGNTPQHGVLFGMTGAGKSVIIQDAIAEMFHINCHMNAGYCSHHSGGWF
jgi:hypothetical protein